MLMEVLETEEVCANCKHFYQHYITDSRRGYGMLAVNSGHCVKPRVKDRKPCTPACKYWEPSKEIIDGRVESK